MEERRKFVRITDLKTVKARIRSSKGKAMQPVEMKDMSLIGINFYFEEELESGRIIQIEISLLDDLPSFELEGKVLWQLSMLGNKFTTGVRFCHNDDKIKDRLVNFIQKQAKNVEESREFIRCAVNTDVVIRDMSNPSVSFSAKTVDMSYGGMKLISVNKLEMGASIELTLVLPGEQEAVEFKGRVAWVRKEMNNNGFSAGIIYAGLGVDTRKKIFKFIEQINKQN